MGLDKDEAEIIRNLVAEYDSFVVGLEKTYWLHKTEDKDVLRVREFLRQQVLIPLVRASTQAVLYRSECVKHEFENKERKHFDRLLFKKGASYQIRLENEDAVVNDFPDFWAGSLNDMTDRRRYNCGDVLFLLDDQKLDFEKLFSCFSQLYVVANLGGALGRSLCNRAKKYNTDYPDRTAVALHDGTKLAVFPGRDVVGVRLEQAICCVVSQ